MHIMKKYFRQRSPCAEMSRTDRMFPDTGRNRQPGGDQAGAGCMETDMEQGSYRRVVLICFAAACFVFFRYAVISDNHTTILALEKQLEQEILRRDNLKWNCPTAEISTLLSFSNRTGHELSGRGSDTLCKSASGHGAGG